MPVSNQDRLFGVIRFMKERIKAVLEKDDRVVFAYLYGSYLKSPQYRDIDIAVYSASEADPLRVSADLKVELHRATGFPPDSFDIRIINQIVERGDVFALLYLKEVFESGQLLVDKVFDKRAEFIEAYGMKYRECEGFVDELIL
ncbi:MAG: nucleotidyltransferase domain-containing protein [Pseudomonadota bacterium]